MTSSWSMSETMRIPREHFGLSRHAPDLHLSGLGPLADIAIDDSL